MHLNGQGTQGSLSPWRRYIRLGGPLLQGKRWQRHPGTGVADRPLQVKDRSISRDAEASSLNLKETYFGNGVSATTGAGSHVSVLLVVILLHLGVIHQIISGTDIQMPAVSVPLQVSFAMSPPAPEKTRIKPMPKPRAEALAEEPVPVEKPLEETQPQVTPPDYKVAHLNNPVPDYPPLSRRLREQGDVILRVFVTPTGLPGEIQLHTSSGYPRLDRATRETVERWRFVPARRGEDPVGAWVLVTINWVLN